MTPTDLATLAVGDSVLGALGRMDEHTVLSVENVVWEPKQRSGYRDVRLTLSPTLSTVTRLWAGGAEVLVKCDNTIQPE